jgi:hypothetical protein
MTTIGASHGHYGELENHRRVPILNMIKLKVSRNAAVKKKNRWISLPSSFHDARYWGYYCINIRHDEHKRLKRCYDGFEVLTAVTMKSTVLRDVMACSLIQVHKCFGGTCGL